MVRAREQAQVRAEAVKAAVDANWRGEKAAERDGQTLIFDRKPEFILNKQGEIIGVDAMVRLFRDGEEVPIDPHRVIINPPTVPRANLTYFDVIDNETGVVTKERVIGAINPAAAWEEAVWDSVIGMPNAKGWRTRGTVTTVYATAPVGAGSVDSSNATYATARTGGTLNISGNHLVGQLPGYSCDEAFVIFDTSGIPDTDTVSAVVASFDGNLNGSTADFVAGLAASSYNGGAVVTGDWVSGAAIPTPELGTWNSSGYSADYNAFTETADFKTAINKTGNTSLIIYSQSHRDGTTPTANEYVYFTDADAAGTTTDPKLDITHAAGGGGATYPGWNQSVGGWW